MSVHWRSLSTHTGDWRRWLSLQRIGKYSYTAVTLPLYIVGFVPPKPDFRDPFCLVEGVRYRMNRRQRRFCKFHARKMKTFARRWVKESGIAPAQHNLHMIPTREQVLSWLENTNYNGAEKANLISVWENVIHPFEEMPGPPSRRLRRFKYFIVNLFGKEEHYPKYKHARGIYARDDVAKIVFGPWIKKAEKELYKHPSFIKNVPVKDRPSYMYNLLAGEGMMYLETDYSSFESHFEECVMNIQIEIYLFIFSDRAGRIFVFFFFSIKMGTNYCKSLAFFILIVACEMSGEMDTSASNGIFNLVFMSYVSFVLFNKAKPRMVVEGDDGLTALPLRDLRDVERVATFCKNIGVLMKMEWAWSMSELSFCGMRFDDVDLQTLCDPYKAVGKLGWTNSYYLSSNLKTQLKLLKCKALSYAYQYPNCPIVGELARKIVDLLSDVELGNFLSRRRDLSVYERRVYREALAYQTEAAEIGSGTRKLFAKCHGIEPCIQLRIEEKISEIDVLEPIELPLLFECAVRNAPEMVDCFEKYVSTEKYISPSSFNKTKNAELRQIPVPFQLCAP